MKLIRLSLIALLGLFVTVGGAWAATNIYDDTYTEEDSSGNWTYKGNVTLSNGTLTATRSTINLKATTDIITVPGDTPTLTATHTGTVFVFAPRGNAGPYAMRLPGTPTTGLMFTFTSDTATTYKIIPGDSDTIKYQNASSDIGDTITSPASSGSTVTLVSGSNAWYVTAMSFSESWVVADN